MASGTILPVHPRPLEGELLSSWLLRTARANGLPLSRFTHMVIGDCDLWRKGINRFISEGQLQALAEKTGVPFDTLWRMSIRSMAERIAVSEAGRSCSAWLLPASPYQERQGRSALQFCPYCFREECVAYYQLYWRLAFVTACVEHKRQLVSRCPRCRSVVVFFRRDLLKKGATCEHPITICWECGFDLAMAQTPKADIRVIKLQSQLEGVVSSGRHTISSGNSITAKSFMKAFYTLCTIVMSMSGYTHFAYYDADTRHRILAELEPTILGLFSTKAK